MSSTYEVIKAAADRHGVPVEALLTIGGIETGFSFSSSANNPVSSASGAFQFTDDTAREYGLVGAKRNDLAAQADAAARMAARNSKALSATLGRAPTAGELYLAHQQGLSGAKALLSNPNSPAVDVLKQFHGGDASKVITQNGGHANMTASQFANRWVAHGNQIAARIPPGEMPTVATALSTVPTPRNAPTPVTPSIDMAQMRRISMPSQIVPDTFARLSKPTRNLGDELGMSPIQGGKQQAPLFDAGFDTRTNAMRMFKDGPLDTQGVFTAESKAPAPIPAMPSPQLAARRATDPTLQAALNARYPAQLPPLPPPANASRPRVSGSVSYAGQDRAPPPPLPTTNVASYSTLGRGSSIPEDYRHNAGMIGGPRINPSAPDRLTAGSPGMGGPVLGGMPPQRVAQIGVDVNGNAAPMPNQRPSGIAVPPSRVAQIPIPRPRPDFLPQVATARDVVPVLPPPIPRPKVAPTPFPRPDFGIGGVDITPLPMTGLDMSLTRRYPIGSTAPIGSLPGTMWQSHTENPVVVRPKAGFRLPGLFGLAQMGLGAIGFKPQWPSMPPAGGPGSGTVFGGGFLSGGRKQTAAVQAQRDAGYSPSEAYDRTNRASVERAIAGAANPDQARRLNQNLGNI